MSTFLSIFGAILSVPLVFALFVLLHRYFVFCRRHEGLARFEDIRETMASRNRQPDRDMVDEWLSRRRYRKAYKAVRKRDISRFG